MKSPRVIIASRLFTPEVGAAAFRLQSLADGLAEDGADVHVITTKPPHGSGDTAAAMRIRISRFPVLRDAGGNVRGYLQYLSFDIPLFFRLLVARGNLVISEPPPTTGAVVAVTSWLRRRPYAYYAADIWTEALSAVSAPATVTRLMRAVEGFALRRAAQVLAISEGVAEKVLEFGTDPSRVSVVGNGVDTHTFAVDGASQETSGPTFVYSGTMSEWQGVDVFIEAFPGVLAKHPDARLHIFGQGSAEAELKSLAARIAPEAVIFNGVVPPNEVARWLRVATGALVSIVPGQGYDFAKPTKIYAAAACGAPVVFAGADASAGAELVTSARLGYHASYAVEAVEAALLQAIDDGDTNSTAVERQRRAAWVSDNASLLAAGRRAAAAALSML